jgi:hypothetical protein
MHTGSLGARLGEEISEVVPGHGVPGVNGWENS